MSEVPQVPVRVGLVRPVRLDPRGVAGPTPGQARGPRWRRTSHGFYVPSEVGEDRLEQRILEASVVLPPGAAVTGWAALRWLGAHWFAGTTPTGAQRPVTLIVSTHDIRPQPGIAITGESCPPRQIVTVDGVSLSRPAWSAAFEMRYATSDRAAVVVLDMAAFVDLVSIEEVVAVLLGQSSWTGVPRGRAGMVLADENSWSPQESWMRLIWTLDAGLPQPLCNVPLFDLAGRHIGTPDLLDPVAGLIGEYDGAAHLELPQRARDVERLERFRAHDLEVVPMVAGDSARLDRFVYRLVSAWHRARRRQPARRTWTLEKPSWWTSTETVAQRRSLSDEQRLRLLRHRAG